MQHDSSACSGNSGHRAPNLVCWLCHLGAHQRQGRSPRGGGSAGMGVCAS